VRHRLRKLFTDREIEMRRSRRVLSMTMVAAEVAIFDGPRAHEACHMLRFVVSNGSYVEWQYSGRRMER